MEDNVNEQVVRIERGGEVVTNEALENFKAMFNFLKGKRDTDIKLFHADKLISRSDLVELNQKVQDKLHLHTVHGSTVNVAITLSNSEVKTFGNWAAFESYDWHQTCFTQTIVLEWDFNILFPNHTVQVPQPHSMRVRIGAGLRPNEFFQVVMSGAEDFEIGEVMADVVFKIDFVNTNLCAELKNLVTAWHEALPKNRPQNSLVRFTRRHKGKIELFIIFIMLISFVFIANIAIVTALPYVNVKTNAQVIKWIYFALSASFPVFYVIWQTSDFYANRVIEKTIERYRKAPMIQLTRGDNNRINETATINNQLLKDLGVNLIGALVGSVLTLLFGQVVPFLVKWFIGVYRG